MGVGAFNDYADSPYGGSFSAPDQPYYHDLNIVEVDGPGDPDVGAVQTALNGVLTRDRGYGGDWSESYVPALWMTASGRGTSVGGSFIPDQTCPPTLDEPSARLGYP